MSKWLMAVAVVGLLAMGTRAGADERIGEIWRSRFGRSPMGIGGAWGSKTPVVDPTDSTLWMIEGGTVTHSSPSGELLARSAPLPAPLALAVNPADSSCWALGGAEGKLLHLSSAATLLSTTEGGYRRESVLTFSPHDGSVWVTGPDYLTEPTVTAHVNAAGVEVARWETASMRVVVNPADGTAWRQEGSAVVCVNADDSERWRVGGFGTMLHAAANRADGSVWVGDDAGRLVHLAGSNGQVLFDNTYTQPIDGVFCYPGDGSVWVNYATAITPDLPPYTAHYTAAGDLWSYSTMTLALNPADGVTVGWYYHGGTLPNTIESRTNTHELLTTWDTDSYGFPCAVDFRDDSLWLGAFHHVTLDGAVLADLPATHFGGDFWLDQIDGSCWALGGPGMLHLSPQGEELGSLPVPDVVTQAMVEPFPYHLTRRFVPADQTWWAVVLGEGVCSLLHLASDGKELSRYDGLGVGDAFGDIQISPADGSLWLHSYFAGIPGVHWGSPNGTIWRFAADGALRSSQSFTYSLSPIPILHDGSMWVIARDLSSGKLIHFGATGEITQEMALPASWTYGSLQEEPGTGDFYALSWHESGTASAHQHVVRLSSTFGPLWEGPPLQFDADALALAADGTLWAWRYGTGDWDLVSGSGIYHLDAGGNEVSRTECLNGPLSVTVARNDSSIWLWDSGNRQLLHAAAEAPLFSDLTFGFWAYDAVEACVEAGAVIGFADGTYRPKDTVTRGQMAAFVARAMPAHIEPTPIAEPVFSDVPRDHQFFHYLQYLYGEGVVTGYSDGTYHPEWTVNRGQMAAFLARAKCGGEEYVPSGPATPSFPDVAPDLKFYRHIEYIYANHITTGKTDGLYHPEEACPRDQMAVFIGRAFLGLP